MRTSIITSLLLLGTLYCFAQNETIETRALTYEEALNLVIENNETLKQAALKVEQCQLESKAKKGLYYPKVSLSANYIMMTEALHLDLTPVRDAITPLYDALGNYGNFSDVSNPDPATNSIVPILPDNLSTQGVRASLLSGKKEIIAAEWDKMIQEQYFGMVSANFTMPIYTGGKIRIANKAVQINVAEASAESRQKLGEVTMDLVERYYGLLLAHKVEGVRAEVMTTMKQHMDDAEKMKNEGFISNTEFLQTKVYYAEAKRENDKATKQVNTVNNALLNTLTFPSDLNVNILSSFFYLENLKPLDYFIKTAANKSPLLEQIEHKKQLAEQKVKLEEGSYLPNIAAMGTYHLMDKDLSPYVPEGMVGVGLTWTIFEGNARNQNLKAAKLQGQQVDLYYSKSKTNIETMITKYYNEVEMQMEQIEQLEVSKAFAQEYYNACDKGFKEGLTTAVELADASLLVAKMEIEQLQATYNYDLILSKLLYYTGIPDKFSTYLNTGIAVK